MTGQPATLEPQHARTLAADPATPASTLETLAYHPDASVRAVLTRLPRPLPHPVLAALANDPDTYLRLTLAMNHAQHLPPDVILDLVNDREPAVAEKAITRSEPIPDDVLIAVAARPSLTLTNALLARPSGLPDDAYRVLFSRPQPLGVWKSLAETPGVLPAFVQQMILDRGLDQPIWELSGRPELTDAIIHAVGTHPSAYVRERAYTRLGIAARGTWKAILADPDTPALTKTIIAETATNATVVTAATKNPDPRIRIAACRNPAITDKAVARLADDLDPEVRAAAQTVVINALARTP